MKIKPSYLSAFLAGIILVFIDQAAKIIALRNFFDYDSFSADILNLAVYRNTGAIFGLPVPPGVFYFIFIFLLFAAIFSRIYKANEIQKSEVAGFTLIFAGAAGNMIDRLRFGYIIDFVNIKGLLIFNLADVFIAGGALILFSNYFPQFGFSGKSFKKKIYIILFTVLGIIASFLVHAAVEIWYIDLLLSNFQKYSFGLGWPFWYSFHHIASVVLLALGALIGYAQGKYWWNILYEKR